MWAFSGASRSIVENHMEKTWKMEKRMETTIWDLGFRV